MMGGDRMPKWTKKAKKALIDKEMTVTDLARALNLSRNYVSLVINGKLVSDGAKEKICEYLNITA